MAVFLPGNYSPERCVYSRRLEFSRLALSRYFFPRVVGGYPVSRNGVAGRKIKYLKFSTLNVALLMTQQQFFEYPYASHYFETGHGRMHYIREGEGPVVVCVHGNPTWSYFYRNLIAELRKTHCVIAPDHLGCGLSDKPQDYEYTLENHIANLQALLAHLALPSFSLVMHDWGGAIGMGVATRRPEQVAQIVILNTAAFHSRHIPARIQLCRIPVLGEYIVRKYNGFAWPATFMAVKKKMKPEVIAGYLAPYDNWNNRIATHRFVVDIPMEKGHPSYDCLSQIEKGLGQFGSGENTILILWGGQDFCFTNSFYLRWLDIFPDAAHHYFPDAGHYLLEDAREEAVSRIVAFFSNFSQSRL